MLSLGIAIVAVIVINAVFTFVQEYRAERVIEALGCSCRFGFGGAGRKAARNPGPRGCSWRPCSPGRRRQGSADARLIEATRLMVNNAPLTGESTPVPELQSVLMGIFWRAQILFLLVRTASAAMAERWFLPPACRRSSPDRAPHRYN